MIQTYLKMWGAEQLRSEVFRNIINLLHTDPGHIE